MKISGLIVPIHTPCIDNNVDVESLKKLTDHLLSNDVDGIFVLGTNGEFQHLSYEQKVEVVKVVAEENNGRTRLLVGISSGTLEETKKLLDLSVEVKADAVVFTPLYGVESTQEKIDFVTEHSKLNILLYNNPGITNGEALDIAVVKTLKENSKVIGIKDSSGNSDYFEELLALSDENFSVYQGRETTALQAIWDGATGIVSGTANAYPSEFKALVAQQTKESQEEVDRVRLETFGSSEDSIALIKKKVSTLGVIASDEMFQ